MTSASCLDLFSSRIRTIYLVSRSSLPVEDARPASLESRDEGVPGQRTAPERMSLAAGWFTSSRRGEEHVVGAPGLHHGRMYQLWPGRPW